MPGFRTHLQYVKGGDPTMTAVWSAICRTVMSLSYLHEVSLAKSDYLSNDWMIAGRTCASVKFQIKDESCAIQEAPVQKVLCWP